MEAAAPAREADAPAREADAPGSPPGPLAGATVQRRRDDRVIGGAVLVTIGLSLLAVQYVPDLGRMIPLLIGLFLLAMYVLRQAYGFLVAGCIVGRVGLGVALQGAVSGTEAGGIVGL